MRFYLSTFTSEAEKLKGSIYSAESREQRWGRKIDMSDDLRVLEMMPDGSAVDITHVLIMANTTGLDAPEAPNSTTMPCSPGGKPTLHSSCL